VARALWPGQIPADSSGMDELARLADRFWPTRWTLRLARPADGRDLWRARLQLRRGWVMLETTGRTARESLETLAEGLRRLDAEQPVLATAHVRRRDAGQRAA
jgi:hypothetical protein